MRVRGIWRVRQAKSRVVRPFEKIDENYQLRREYPFLQSYVFPDVATRTGLGDKYQQYTTSVSRSRSAMSVELACLLTYMCENLNPKTILDTGSGFSSYMFRRYRESSGRECKIYSVDDNPEWLEKTRIFLEGEGLSADGLMTWDEFLKSPPAVFDLVSHDIGPVAGRAQALPKLLQMIGREGVVLVDDMHKDHFRKPIENILRNYRVRTYDMSRYSLDEYGRYAWMIAGFK